MDINLSLYGRTYSESSGICRERSDYKSVQANFVLHCSQRTSMISKAAQDLTDKYIGKRESNLDEGSYECILSENNKLLCN